jgi:hypothetical protein
MANRNLLKEAIADAKSVKEAAIANAKAALEEAFTPYLKERFSAKLAEMETNEDMDYENDPEMEENYSEGEVGEMSASKEEKRTGKMREKPGVDEMNLDELLAELDEEMIDEEEMEETLNEQEEDMDMDGMEMDSEEEGEEDDEIDLEDMTEDELKDLIEDVIEDMVRAGELEAGEKFEDEEDDEDDEEIDFEEEDEEEIVSERKHYGGNDDNIPSAKRGKIKKDTAEEEGKADYERSKKKIKEGVIDENIMSKIKGMSEEMLMKLFGVKTVGELLAALGGAVSAGKKMEEAAEVDEMNNTIQELASTLSEVKLLNAKLLYTNKIFRAKNLNETQKVKVLEAFDKAASVRDAKLIYETLTTVKETKTAVTESMRGMASKAAGMAPEKKPILEVNDQFARWQILAGIKRN